MNILLTGFGPFPGAPFNPTGPLVEKLMRSRPLALTGVRRTSHVFRTSYEAVDRELPALLARTKPDVLVMFGLAARTRHVRIETRARNSYSRVIPDASGHRPRTGTIAPGAATTLALVPGDAVEVSLATEDADADHAYLRERGVDADAEVMRMGDYVPPMFTFRDPDGNRFRMVQRD